MTPEKFLKITTSPGQFNKNSLDYIDNLAQNEEKFNQMFIDVDTHTCRVRGHEGRHRALWAYKNEVPCVPVVIYHKKLVNDPVYDKVHRFTEPSQNCSDKLKRELGIKDTAWQARNRPLR